MTDQLEISAPEGKVTVPAATLARINPNEAIVTDALYGDADIGPLLRELSSVTPLTRDVFDSATAERRLCDYFAVATMDGLSAMSRLEATIPHPFFGALNWRETLLFMRLHDHDHAGQLQKVAAAL